MLTYLVVFSEGLCIGYRRDKLRLAQYGFFKPCKHHLLYSSDKSYAQIAKYMFTKTTILHGTIQPVC